MAAYSCVCHRGVTRCLGFIHYQDAQNRPRLRLPVGTGVLERGLHPAQRHVYVFDMLVYFDNDIWAVGAGATTGHWNGSQWSVVPNPGAVKQPLRGGRPQAQTMFGLLELAMRGRNLRRNFYTGMEYTV